jgi:predicted transcriptional regulator
LGNLIAEVHRALNSTHAGGSEPEPEPLSPAVNPKRSVFPDYIICLEDGKKFKSLKRHLRTHHEMSPEEYRQKWGLAHDYPIVAPNYAAARSALAKKLGLGQQRRRKS